VDVARAVQDEVPSLWPARPCGRRSRRLSNANRWHGFAAGSLASVSGSQAGCYVLRWKVSAAR